MARILKGADVARALTEKLTEQTAMLKERSVEPCLAILRVGEREDDLSYERGAVKRCEKVGIRVKQVVFKENVPQEVLLDAIRQLNGDESIHSVLLLRPLPRHLDDEAVRRALLPAKDVDGITDGSFSAIYAGTQAGFPPCTAQACIELLRAYEIPIAGRRAVVVGRSLVIGKPVAMLLLAENATVTVCHSRSQDLPALCKEADILIVAAGKAGMVGSEYLRPGQTVLDVGIHAAPDGGLRGDVIFDEAAKIVDAITPVPGGVGAVTTAVLASHVVQAAARTQA